MHASPLANRKQAKCFLCVCGSKQSDKVSGQALYNEKQLNFIYLFLHSCSVSLLNFGFSELLLP